MPSIDQHSSALGVSDHITSMLREARNLMCERRNRYVVYWNGDVHSIGKLEEPLRYDERNEAVDFMRQSNHNFYVVYRPYDDHATTLWAFFRWMMEKWVK